MVHREAVAGVQVALPRLTNERDLTVRRRVDGAQLPDGVEIERPATPGEPPEGAKILLRQREAICAKCEMFHGVCFELFGKLRACTDPQKPRQAWMAYAGTLTSRCPRGRWGHGGNRKTPEPRAHEGAGNPQSDWSPAQPSRGLGDTIAKATSKLGITPCEGCKERQAALNKLVPYSNSATS